MVTPVCEASSHYYQLIGHYPKEYKDQSDMACVLTLVFTALAYDINQVEHEVNRHGVGYAQSTVAGMISKGIDAWRASQHWKTVYTMMLDDMENDPGWSRKEGWNAPSLNNTAKQ